MPMVNLTPGPLTFMRSGGRQHGDEPGSEFITLPPSGRVAVVVVHTTLIPVVEHEPIGSVFVDIHEIDGVPEVRNLPTDPGHYIVSAQVIDALGPEQVEQCRGRGSRLYTPRHLVFPGHTAHPGTEVLPGPYAPGLIRRV